MVLELWLLCFCLCVLSCRHCIFVDNFFMCAAKVLERDSKANIFKGLSAEKGYPHRVPPFSEDLNEFTDLSPYFRVKHWLQATETKVWYLKYDFLLLCWFSFICSTSASYYPRHFFSGILRLTKESWWTERNGYCNANICEHFRSLQGTQFLLSVYTQPWNPLVWLIRSLNLF